MCLLDAVESWDPSGIVCISTSHRDMYNPLRNRDQLHVICGLEYAAQAMAVHVGLTSPPQPITSAIGFLGGVRELQCNTSRLDLHAEPLKIEGSLLINQRSNFMYHFNIKCEGEVLLEGRASIFIQQGITQS